MTSLFQRRPEYALSEPGQLLSYTVSASFNTLARKYRLRSSGVRKSTFLSPNKLDSSRSIRAIPRRPGMLSASNSTRTSTSLSGPKSGRSAEPNMAKRRTPRSRQNEAIRSLEICTWGFIPNLPHTQNSDPSDWDDSITRNSVRADSSSHPSLPSKNIHTIMCPANNRRVSKPLHKPEIINTDLADRKISGPKLTTGDDRSLFRSPASCPAWRLTWNRTCIV